MTNNFLSFSVILATIAIAAAPCCKAELTLQDAVLQQKTPKGINPMIPAVDGNFYYELTDGGSKIIKCDYKNCCNRKCIYIYCSILLAGAVFT